METMPKSSNPLETEPLSKLLLRYSIPTTLTLMVNYLYSIVDQIFVGQGVGITGMAAVNVAFPVSILVNAVSLLLGDGCAANVSLCLGRKEQETANRIFGHAVTWIITSGIVLALVCGIFTPQIVRLFGSTDTAYGEAAAYLRVIAWGIPFQLICPAFTAMIRADGAPQYTMKCMMTGAVINLILDPVFIFGLNMGVVGAGIATVIGEIAAGVLCLLYLRRLQTIHLTKAALRPTWPLTRRILKLGLPSLLTQSLTALVQIVLNNLMRVYGAVSIYGSDIALSVYGMMMKVYQIAHSMFVGVSSAVQPINGYNFGAKNYDRVRKTYRMATGAALVISALWWLIYLLLPRQLAMLFVSNEPLYEWLYERIDPYYCHDNGRPGTDPVVLIKMVLIQHLFRIPSLRQTYREIQVNVAYRWFLGYGLLDNIPHFATVSYAFCKHFPEELTSEIFEHIH